jgi:hypothetical protein
MKGGAMGSSQLDLGHQIVPIGELAPNLPLGKLDQEDSGILGHRSRSGWSTGGAYLRPDGDSTMET